MKKETLNHEMKIFDSNGKEIFATDFYGESKDLAHDHAWYMLWNSEFAVGGVICHYRRIGAINWKIIKK